MAWQTIYDVRHINAYPLAPLLLVLCFVIPIGAFIINKQHKARPRPAPRNLATLLGASLLVVIGAWVIFQRLPSTQNYIRLKNLLVSGQFSEISGTIIKAQIFEESYRHHHTLVFNVGDRRFMFPYRSPISCFPQNGDAVKIDFVPNPNSASSEVTDTILRLSLTRSCPLGMWK